MAASGPKIPPIPAGAGDWQAALYLMDRADTWEALRSWLKALGIVDRLSLEERQDLGVYWERKEAFRLDDPDLIRDLEHWAAGKTRNDHPKGFQAPRPSVLVTEAAARGWFTRELPGNRYLVNPPNKKPITLSEVL